VDVVGSEYVIRPSNLGEQKETRKKRWRRERITKKKDRIRTKNSMKVESKAEENAAGVRLL